MRTSLRVLAAVAAAAVPAIPAVAVNIPTGTPTKPAHPEKPACKPIPQAGVAYIVRGILTEDATANEISLTVTGGNYFGRTATKDALREVVTVPIGDCTKIKKVTMRKRLRMEGWTKLNTGDRVLIKWRATRGKTVDELGEAWRIVELGRGRPAPQPTS